MPQSEIAFAAGFAPATDDAWRKLVEKALKGADFEKRLVARTRDGLRIEPVYSRKHALPAADAMMPGAPPYTRGVKPARQGHGWEIRQAHAGTDPHAVNAAILEDISAGAGGVTIQLAAPGQAGLAPASLIEALAGVDLSAATLALQPGEAFEAGAAALSKSSAAPGRRVRINADPIGCLARNGGLARPLMELMAAATRLAADPAWRSGDARVLLADGRPCHEAGGSEAQELATMLAAAVAYLRALEAAGTAPMDGLPRIGFALAADADLFLSIAKLRAARRLIHAVADASGAAAAIGSVEIAVSTSERMMARRDPWVNMLRTAAACMGAGLGGADAITVLPYTAALGEPDAFARRIARNTQIVAQEESALGRVADPAGGAWSVERLSEDIAKKAWSLFQEIEAEGGMVAALKSGLIQDQVAAVAAERAKAIATGRIELTGVSTFPRLADDGVAIRPMTRPAIQAGTQDAVTPLAPLRLGEAFEALRDIADRAAQSPRVFLASLGSQADHSGRTTWTRNFLAAGGVAADGGEGVTNSADAGLAFSQSGATIACICSSDAVYAELAEAVAGVLKQAGAQRVYLAGRPKDDAALKAAGVDGFWFAGQDAVAALTKLQGELGIV